MYYIFTLNYGAATYVTSRHDLPKGCKVFAPRLDTGVSTIMGHQKAPASTLYVAAGHRLPQAACITLMMACATFCQRFDNPSTPRGWCPARAIDFKLR